MSLPDSGRNNVEKRKPALVHQAMTVVDTNLLLQKAIQQLPQTVKNAIILRCDELARLQISEEALEKAFVHLLQMITEGRETDVKLFLHITCSAERKHEREKGAASISRYKIQFHTNSCPLAGRIKEAERRMDSIASLLLPFDGSLEVNQLKHSGSVFIITLPGK
jgi:hypothetical protein